ncbi:MAG: C40 family peptidase [Crocinitomicaceae bacterium]
MQQSLLFILLFCGCTAIAQDSTAVSIRDSSDTVRYQTDEALVEDIIEYAKKFLGTPYVYGGSTPSGFDCSGYVRYVMKNFGIELSRTSASQSEYGKEIPLSEVKAGDLLFFRGRNISSSRIGHVAMVISNENDIIQFIHAAGNKVKIDTFNDSRYYVPRFLKATRLDLQPNNTTE